jgi:hypothetical protein
VKAIIKIDATRPKANIAKVEEKNCRKKTVIINDRGHKLPFPHYDEVNSIPL